MACYQLYDKDRKPYGFICGDLGPHCTECGDLSANLCDFPVGKNKTCDRNLCEFHSSLIAPDIHYCAGHYSEWKKFKDSGGVKCKLENLIPFKER